MLRKSTSEAIARDRVHPGDRFDHRADLRAYGARNRLDRGGDGRPGVLHLNDRRNHWEQDAQLRASRAGDDRAQLSRERIGVIE